MAKSLARMLGRERLQARKKHTRAKNEQKKSEELELDMDDKMRIIALLRSRLSDLHYDDADEDIEGGGFCAECYVQQKRCRCEIQECCGKLWGRCQCE